MSGGNRCLINHLENPHLNGITLGLDAADHYQPKVDMFACCDGDGMRFDDERNACVPCPLKSRLRRTRELIGQFFRVWPEQANLPAIAANHSSSLLEQAAQVIKGQAAQGQIMAGQWQQPGKVWLLAIALAWRFGYPVHLVSFKSRGQNPRLPTASTQPPIVVVEQFSRLADPNDRNHLEALINYTYKTNGYFFLEFASKATSTAQSPAAPQHQAASRTRRQAMRYRQMINSLKERPPLVQLAEFLEPDSYSQLASLCQLPRMTFTDEADFAAEPTPGELL